MKVPYGIRLEPETKTFAVMGQKMPVGMALRFDRVEPGTPREPHVVKFLQQIFPDREISPDHIPCQESVHLTILAGENGHWVEVDLWENGGVSARLGDDEEPFEKIKTDVSPFEILRLLREASLRTDPPPQHDDPLADNYGDPFGGFVSGAWVGWE